MGFLNSSDVVIGVGDSVRFVPGKASDWSGNGAHARNPWVRIVGKQRARVESVPFVSVDEKTAPSKDAPVTRIVKISSGQDAESILKEQGIPGHIIRFDLANAIANFGKDIEPKDAILSFQTGYYTNTGTFVNQSSGTISCADSIFQGDCTKYPGQIFLGWNLRSSEGRLVSTGAYISSLTYNVKLKNISVSKMDNKQIWGIRRK